MRTWNTINKENYIRGEWDNEPDKVQWEHMGLDCLIVRNHLGALCGYVGVPKSHRYYKKHYDKIENVEVHGGLTFSNICDPMGTESEGICHTNGVNEKVWWLGFDCAHYRDTTPGLEISFCFPDTIYRNIDYVKNEVENLAKQLVQSS